MTYQQHTITGSNAKQRDKADNSRNAYLTRCYHQCKYPTNQRQRQIQQNDSTLGCILKLGIKQQEDNHDTHKRSEHQRTAGRLLAFKLTAIFHMISFGKLDLRINPFLYIIHHAAQITAAGIGWNHNLTLHVLTADSIRSHGRNHIGYIVDRDFLTVTGINHQVTHFLHLITHLILGTDNKIKRFAFFIYLRNNFTRHVYRYKFGKVRQGNTEFGKHLAFGNNLELRTFDLLFHIQVGNTLHATDSILYLITDGKHLVQIVTKQFDGNVGLGTRKHGIDTMADRLAYFDIRTGNGR